MANLLNFKFGQYARLPETKVAGTVYVTTDEQAMYIDLPESQAADAEIKRIRLGDIMILANATEAKPPFNIGFYYFVDENAFMRWDGSAWKQINSVSDLQAKYDKAIEDLNKAIEAEADRASKAEAANATNITKNAEAIALRATTADFEAYKTSNNAAVSAAQTQADKGVTDAAAAKKAADDAQAQADKGVADAAEAKRVADAAVTQDQLTNAIKDFATDSEVDAVKTAILGEADYAGTVKGAYAAAAEADRKAGGAQQAAETAQSKANDAYDLAGQKITEAEVDAKLANYSTTTQMNNAIKAVQGDTTKTVEQAYAFASATKDSLDALAEEVDKKTTMAAVKTELNNYATKQNLADEKSLLLGSDASEAGSYNIYGAVKAAAAAQEQANKGVTDAAAAKKAADAAQAAADAAQKRADEAHDLADAAVTTDELNAAIADFATDSELEATKTAILGEADYAGTVKGAYAAAATADGKADGAQAAAEAAQKRADDAYDLADAAVTAEELNAAIADFATDGEVDAKVAAARGNTAETVASAYAKAVDANTAAGAAQDRADAAYELASKKTTAAEVDAKLENYDTSSEVDTKIANAIAANDAMTFKGVVNVANAGGTTTAPANAPANKGDTYKVGTAGIYAGSISAKVGDLLIYEGDDGTNDASKWTHISSGYEDDYLQKIFATNVDNADTADGVKLHISNGIDSDEANSASHIVLVGSGDSNVRFVADGNTVTATMVWGTF